LNDDTSCNDCCGVANGDNSSCTGFGDVNADGSVSITDVVALVAHILGTYILDDCAANEGDMNNDGTTDVMDIIAQVDAIISGMTFGCMDSTAPEYNPAATDDDGTCWTTCGGNLSYLGDGDCDSSNNNAECAYDGGDCCESTCVPGTYSCSDACFSTCWRYTSIIITIWIITST
jgi:hypothetical protein